MLIGRTQMPQICYTTSEIILKRTWEICDNDIQ